MEGNSVVVAGGAGGLGSAAVEMFASRGARVAIIDVDAAAIARRVAALNELGHQVVGIQGDITVQSQAVDLFGQAVDALGQVHAMVNCVGFYPRRAILEIDDEAFDKSFVVNLRATHNMMVAAVRHMREYKQGRIVNISSVDAFKPHPQNAHYAAMKAAVVSLTKSFAQEFAPDQILINSVAPGAILTERMQAGVAEEIARATPLGRCAQPEDIAETICFLASPSNRYTTGENTIVGGGYVMV